MQNIDSDLIRGNIDTIILKTMLDEDKYGLDIIKEVENKSNGTYELKQPTLYSCLKRLENQELISSYWVDSEIGGRRHYYKLTEKGKQELENKQDEWSRSKFVIDNLLGGYNPDEYRLVSRQDYDKIIGGKKFEYTGEDEEMLELAKSEAENAPPPAPPVQMEYVEKIVPEEITKQEDIPNQGIDGTYLNGNADINQTFMNFNVVPDNYKSQESNYIARLKMQEKLSNEEPKPAPTEITAIQQNLLFDENLSNENTINESVDEFEKSIAELANFKQGARTSLADFEDEKFEDETYENFEENEQSEDFGINYQDANFEPYEEETTEFEEKANDEFGETYEFSQEETYDFEQTQDAQETDNDTAYFEETIQETESQQEAETESFKFPENITKTDDKNFLSELDELGSLSYENQYSALSDENKKTEKTQEIIETNVISPVSNETNSVKEEEISKETSEETEDAWAEEIASTNEPENSTYPYSSENPEQAPLWQEREFYQAQNTTQTSFEDVISSTEYTRQFEAEYKQKQQNSYNPPPPPKDEPNFDYKQKLNSLSSYSKTTSNDESLKKAKDINSLKTEFESEGIKVTEFKKEQLSEINKNYLLSNKLNMVKGFILLFGYIFLLSAIYIILNSTSFKTFSYNFSFNAFLIGFIPFGIYAIYHLVMYIINPYKKVPAKYSPAIMLLIATILTVQLLLITYCVNLQLGFYSFTQNGYNHLYWIVPLVISFAPLVSTGIHCALFYSRNFNV